MSFKEKFQESLEMRTTGIRAWYTDEAAKYQRNLSKIEMSQELTDVGKSRKSHEYRQAARKQLLKDARDAKQQHIALLDQVIAEAKKVTDKLADKPPAEEQAKFTKALSRFKTESMLATRFDSLMSKFNQFSEQNVKSQYEAELLADEFPEIIQQALSVAENKDQAKLTLARKYEDITTALIPEDVREANEVIAAAEREKETPLFNLSVREHANGLFGRDIADSLNNPESLLERIETEEDGGE
ncbi:hypothetical protein [Virgibacillus salexigens]|uniref:PspA/IM30 family protein n=1 Tax=Virgibacillus kapii TaxID=1638645 RepID=A0ABQ2D8B5_9BACI|nr:hypothetical protein [Virgibacillus kapii]GGJ49618.1 hypothetical protein GCM10007111_09710 [Virgibacillus kapii]